MKTILAAAIACALGVAGMASAGMQGQGTKPDAKVSEMKEAAKKGMSSEAEVKKHPAPRKEKDMKAKDAGE